MSKIRYIFPFALVLYSGISMAQLPAQVTSRDIPGVGKVESYDDFRGTALSSDDGFHFCISSDEAWILNKGNLGPQKHLTLVLMHVPGKKIWRFDTGRLDNYFYDFFPDCFSADNSRAILTGFSIPVSATMAQIAPVRNTPELEQKIHRNQAGGKLLNSPFVSSSSWLDQRDPTKAYFGTREYKSIHGVKTDKLSIGGNAPRDVDYSFVIPKESLLLKILLPRLFVHKAYLSNFVVSPDQKYLSAIVDVTGFGNHKVGVIIDLTETNLKARPFFNNVFGLSPWGRDSRTLYFYSQPHGGAGNGVVSKLTLGPDISKQTAADAAKVMAEDSWENYDTPFVDLLCRNDRIPSPEEVQKVINENSQILSEDSERHNYSIECVMRSKKYAVLEQILSSPSYKPTPKDLCELISWAPVEISEKLILKFGETQSEKFYAPCREDYKSTAISIANLKKDQKILIALINMKLVGTEREGAPDQSQVAKDLFYYHAARNFNNPFLCEKINPGTVMQNRMAEAGFQASLLKSECYYNYAITNRKAGFCKKVIPVNALGLNGSKISSFGCDMAIKTNQVVRGGFTKLDVRQAELIENAGIKYGDLGKFKDEMDQLDDRKISYDSDIAKKLALKRSFKSAYSSADFKVRLKKIEAKNPSSKVHPPTNEEMFFALAGVELGDSEICMKVPPTAVIKTFFDKELRNECLLHAALTAVNPAICKLISPRPNANENYKKWLGQCAEMDADRVAVSDVINEKTQIQVFEKILPVLGYPIKKPWSDGRVNQLKSFLYNQSAQIKAAVPAALKIKTEGVGPRRMPTNDEELLYMVGIFSGSPEVCEKIPVNAAIPSRGYLRNLCIYSVANTKKDLRICEKMIALQESLNGPPVTKERCLSDVKSSVRRPLVVPHETFDDQWTMEIVEDGYPKIGISIPEDRPTDSRAAKQRLRVYSKYYEYIINSAPAKEREEFVAKILRKF